MVHESAINQTYILTGLRTREGIAVVVYQHCLLFSNVVAAAMNGDVVVGPPEMNDE
jgi:hypothetical protein